MSLRGWEELACPTCEGRDFLPLFRLQWQNGLGTSTRPNGYWCVRCQAPIDHAKMINHAKKNELEAKRKELEAEIGSA